MIKRPLKNVDLSKVYEEVLEYERIGFVEDPKELLNLRDVAFGYFLPSEAVLPYIIKEVYRELALRLIHLTSITKNGTMKSTRMVSFL